MELTLEFVKKAGSFPCTGINNFTPNFGGNDCDRRCPIACCSIILAGDRGTFRSTSGGQVASVMKPVLQLFNLNGILSLVVSYLKLAIK